jgi:hypothetical protein
MAKQERQYKYLKIGAAWDGEYGISGSLEGPMSLEKDQKVKFYLFKNEKKEPGSKSPDYHVMTKNPDYDGATRPAKTQPKDDGLPF